MEIFKLLGTIAIDNQAANSGIDETTDKAEKAHPRISAAFSKIGHAATVAGKTIAAGLAAGATAMGTLTVKALNLSGELEQNMGGSEAVFGDYAGKMQRKATQAYSKMGLSASNYLATANKMGALFKGAGFDMEEASNLASEAMQRAADVASIMGIDTTAAMESIAGAAKGNFTMMDNLGVAMNDTAIEAYALSKGIDKATKDMTQQEKIGLAMEMFLEKTAYAAGNYAKENETLAGSLGTAKAALSNFLDGSGDVEMLAEAFVNAAGVISEKLQELLPRLVGGMQRLLDQLLPHLPGMIETLLPGVISGATALLTGLISALPKLLQILIAQIPSILSRLGAAIASAFPVLLQTVKTLFEQIKTAIEEKFPELEETFAVIGGLFSGIWEAMQIVWEEIGQPIFDAVSSAFSAARDALQPLIDAFTEYVIEGEFARDITAAATAAVNALKDAYSAVCGFINNVVTGFKDAVTWCKEHETAITLLAIAFGTLTTAIVAYNVANSVKQAGGIVELAQLAATAVAVGALTVAETAHTVATTVATAATTAFSAALSFITSPITLVVTAIGALIAIITVCVKHWDEIKEAAKAAWEIIKNVWSAASSWFNETVIQPIANFFTDVWEGIKKGASTAWSFVRGIWEAVTGWFDRKIAQPLSKLFTNLWEGIKNAFKAPINWIIDGINLFIRGLNKIRIPDWVPGVGGLGFHIDELPQLEEGGILEKGQVGLLEGNGAEAVVPLDQNKAWINAVARDMNTAIGGDNKLLERNNELLEMLIDMLPEALTDAFKSMKFDVNNREFARLVKAVN